jgi:hypothetical protein
MASTQPIIRNRGAAGTIMDITLTIPETLEIIKKPGSATSQSIITAACDIGFLTNYGIKKHKKKITSKNLGQWRYCLTNGIFNNWAPLQS